LTTVTSGLSSIHRSIALPIGLTSEIAVAACFLET
jgi:hypothetical protein